MQVSIPVGIFIMACIWSLPVLEVYLIHRFIKWQEFRKRTFAGIVVGKDFAVRLKGREDFWGDAESDVILDKKMAANKIHNTILNDYLNSKVKTIKQVSPDGSRELTLGYEKEGF